MKKFVGFFLSVLMVFSLINPVTIKADDTDDQPVQIVEEGGYLDNQNNDGVSIGKVIEKTDLENVFDITLTVKTPETAITLSEDPDVAVVLVLDVSNTMTEFITPNDTKYSTSILAIESFLESFAEYNKGYSNIGAVAFNTNSYEICEMQHVSNDEQKEAFLNQFRTNTHSILYADGYGQSPTRFTDMEAGLQRAYDMLKDMPNENKYIIFMTDGLPTTYLKDSSTYEGYTPSSDYGTVGEDGVFYDAINGNYNHYGTNYSDKGAMRAQAVANNIKQDGIEVFSIGMGVTSFEAYHADGTVRLASSDYIMDQVARGGAKTVVYHDGSSYTYTSRVSTIDNNLSTSYENWDGQLSIGNVKTDSNAFQTWLRNGIGSGHYYSTENYEELNEAFIDIFNTLSERQVERLNELWVTCDPIPTTAEGTQYVEFVGMFNKQGELANPIVGTYTENGENTASYDAETNEITWNVRSSGYTISNEKSGKQYTFKLKYRVRLDNEYIGFSEEEVYPTNGDAKLKYRTVDLVEKDGKIVEVISEPKELAFPIPSVEGYYVSITFNKVSSIDFEPVPGAVFELVHDEDTCGYCYGDGESTVDIDSMTATSQSDGTVTFTNVPSGHKYILRETQAPECYELSTDYFEISVDYDEMTIVLVHADGSSEEIDAATFASYNFTNDPTIDNEPNPNPENPDPENPDPENPDPENPDPENPDPENPDPENPDPENPDPENPDPENPDPENPDPENPGNDDGVQEPQNPDTGDSVQLMMISLVSVLSLTWAAIVMYSKRKLFK